MRILVLSNLYPPNVVGGYDWGSAAAKSQVAEAFKG